MCTYAIAYFCLASCPVTFTVTSSVTWFIHSLNDVYMCVTEEKKTAQSVQNKLWELLAPAGLTDDSGSSPWLHAYRQFLQEDGTNAEMQNRAILMQLWATQVSETT